jgi:hypothetical protein
MNHSIEFLLATGVPRQKAGPDDRVGAEQLMSDPRLPEAYREPLHRGVHLRAEQLDLLRLRLREQRALLIDCNQQGDSHHARPRWPVCTDRFQYPPTGRANLVIGTRDRTRDQLHRPRRTR